jgi:hypothetical protein
VRVTREARRGVLCLLNGYSTIQPCRGYCAPFPAVFTTDKSVVITVKRTQDTSVDEETSPFLVEIALSAVALPPPTTEGIAGWGIVRRSAGLPKPYRQVIAGKLRTGCCRGRGAHNVPIGLLEPRADYICLNPDIDPIPRKTIDAVPYGNPIRRSIIIRRRRDTIVWWQSVSIARQVLLKPTC